VSKHVVHSDRHVRYGDTASFRQTLQRRLGEAVDELVDFARGMNEGPAKRALKDELTAIAHSIRAIEARVIGSQVSSLERRQCRG
jgi:hypothetical protein